jgi:uncharacterized protein YegL
MIAIGRFHLVVEIIYSHILRKAEMTRPGGKLATLPLHFVWLADCSGSMTAEGKMASLNHAARESLPHLRRVAMDNPNATVLLRVLTFSTGAVWAHGEPTPERYFHWPDLTATPGGRTDLGAALKLLARELRPTAMQARALPPVLVLLTDGYPTDDYKSGLAALMSEPWGAKAIRIAIAIGRNADYDALRRFIGNPQIAPLNARNADELTRYLRWASTSVLQTASSAVIGAGSGPGLRPPANSELIHNSATW